MHKVSPDCTSPDWVTPDWMSWASSAEELAVVLATNDAATRADYELSERLGAELLAELAAEDAANLRAA